MLDLRYVSVICLLFLQGTAAEPNPKRDAVYYPLSARMSAARSNANAIVEIAQIARQAEQDFAQNVPEVLPMVFGEAAKIIGYSLQTDKAPFSTYYEMVHRQRRYLEFIPLEERFQTLSATSLPLNSEYEQIPSAANIKSHMITELEVLLDTWRKLNDEIERVKDWKFEVVYSTILPPTNPSDFVEQNRYQEEGARNRAAGKRNNHVHVLRVQGASFTNAVMRQVAREYGKSPHLLAQLQEVMDGYLPPADSTNVMNKVFAAMKPDVAAKAPRPVPGAKGERWIRPPAPRPEPGLPAIAKPSRIREGISNRSNQAVATLASSGTVSGAEPAGSGAEHRGGRPVWLWAVLGVGAFAWAWWKLRR